jgi:hypothetical protein
MKPLAVPIPPRGFTEAPKARFFPSPVNLSDDLISWLVADYNTIAFACNGG